MSAAQLPFSGQQQFDTFNRVVPLARLYVYLANTSTPVAAFANKALSVALPWPVVANGAGRFPAIWIDDTPENVRLVVTDAAGTLIYEDDECPVIGPSRWAQGDTPVVDATRLVPTGFPFWAPIDGAIPYYVRMNDRTIGNASSGATERAGDDCEDLFVFLWDKTTSTVSGGRGSSAAVDWAANKTIVVPSMRGRGPVGLDTMGNSAAGVVAGLTTAGAIGGAATKALSIAEMPAHDHGGATGSNGGHSHTTTIPQITVNQGSAGGGAFFFDGASSNTGSVPNHTHTIGSQGSGTGFSILNPYMAGTWYMKL